MSDAPTLPCIAQHKDGHLFIFNKLIPEQGNHIRWQPLPVVPLPVKDAYQEWLASDLICESEYTIHRMRKACHAATDHAKQEERKRFSLGVEKLVSTYGMHLMIAEGLRALAKGEDIAP